LRPAGRTLALLAGFSRLVYASMWILMSLNQLTALRLLNGADYLRVLGTEQAQTLGRLYLSGFDAYYVGLLFYGFASTACSYLLLVISGPFALIYLPSKLIVRGDAAATRRFFASVWWPMSPALSSSSCSHSRFTACSAGSTRRGPCSWSRSSWSRRPSPA